MTALPNTTPADDVAARAWRFDPIGLGRYAVFVNPFTGEDVLSVAINALLSPALQRQAVVYAEGRDRHGWDRWVVDLGYAV